MNEPVRLSASGSPLAKQLLLAGRRERPRDERKAAAVAVTLLVATGGWTVFFRKFWRATWLFRVLALIGGAAVFVSVIAILVIPSPMEPGDLVSEPVLVERRETEPLPFVPAIIATPL